MMEITAEVESKALQSPYSIMRLVKSRNPISNDNRTVINCIVSIKHEEVEKSDIIIGELIPLVELDGGSSYRSSQKDNITKFVIAVDHRFKTISFKSEFDRLMHPILRGRGLGSYTFSQILMYIKQEFPSAYNFSYARIALPRGSTENDARVMRSFFERFGFSVEVDQEASPVLVIKEADLLEITPHVNNKKLEELDLIEFLLASIKSNNKIRDDINVLKTSMEKEIYDGKYGITHSEFVKWGVMSSILLALLVVLIIF